MLGEKVYIHGTFIVGFGEFALFRTAIIPILQYKYESKILTHALESEDPKSCSLIGRYPWLAFVSTIVATRKD